MLLERYRSETKNKSSRKVYELIAKEYDRLQGSEGYHGGLFGILKDADREVYNLIAQEYRRLSNTLQLIAAENQCSRAILGALGSIVQNKTSEGFAGARFHGGCEVVDCIERLATERAKQAFGAKYANVQPHSGSTANQIVFTAVLKPGDKILSLGTAYGGHPSHGADGSLAGKFFDVENYAVDAKTFLFDYDRIVTKALEIKPKLILCGASAYPRRIDFAKFRAIADRIDAYLLADISHIAGQVIAGAHPSPVDYAHFTTTSTYKAGGPRGGLVLSGKDYQQKISTGSGTFSLWELIEKAAFPGVQGTPYFNNIAAKAVFMKEAVSDEYKSRQFKIIKNAKRLAENLSRLGLDVLSDGTDTHMILVNVAGYRRRLNGVIAQKALEQCGIVVDSYKLPFEKTLTNKSGLRLGTPIVTRNGMGTDEMDIISEMIKQILKKVKAIGGTKYKIKETFQNTVKEQVSELCSSFPVR